MYAFKTFGSLLLGVLAGLLILYGFPAFSKEYNLAHWVKIPLGIFMFVFAYIVGNATFIFLTSKVRDPQLKGYDEYSIKRREFVIEKLGKDGSKWHEDHFPKIILPKTCDESEVRLVHENSPDFWLVSYRAAAQGLIDRYDKLHKPQIHHYDAVHPGSERV